MDIHDNRENSYITPEELIHIHRDFWDHSLKNPIINDRYSFWRRINNMITPDKNNKDAKSPVHADWKGKEAMVIKPEMLIPERHQDFYEYDMENGDPIIYPVFNTIIPWTMVTWLPAMAGARIMVSERGQTLWPEPYIGKGWQDMEDYGVDYNYKWLEKLTEFTAYLTDKYFPSRMISLEMFSRGPGDILLSVMDNEVAFTSLFDYPEDLKKLIMQFADLHIKWSEAQLGIISSFKGGYCNQWGIWAPGKVTRIQEDFTVNLSEDHYREFIMPADSRVIEASEYQVFHTHSGKPECARWVAGIDKLKALEVTIDPVSPPFEEMIGVWKEIAEKKSLIITGTITKDQVNKILNSLDCSGLFLDIIVNDD